MFHWSLLYFELCENIRFSDVLTKLGFWPFWPGKWPSRSIMTLNLNYVAFVPYVGQFSVICMVVLATFGTFLRLIFRRKEPHVYLPHVLREYRCRYRHQAVKTVHRPRRSSPSCRDPISCPQFCASSVLFVRHLRPKRGRVGAALTLTHLMLKDGINTAAVCPENHS